MGVYVFRSQWDNLQPSDELFVVEVVGVVKVFGALPGVGEFVGLE